MADLNVNSIGDASGGTTTSINGFTPTVSNMAGRNLIINGAMQISQRGDYISPVSASNNGYYLDRWVASIGAVSATVKKTDVVQVVVRAISGCYKELS